MALAPGTRLGPYEVTAQIGAGGMGEVYQATDTSLKRQVAIKVLPAALAADAERLARFQREAEVLASLNHPHIANIHGLEKSSGHIALVMELVEGEDLSQRIARSAMPIEDALPIARQIAEALEAAHEQNIIHRDLKPANIKVRPDGTVKVLDFGLAKALSPEGPGATAGASVSMSPTITTPAMTQAGIILGTAAYMSPEQAKGRAVDKRSDVWAFGAVLYEMLTGTRAFGGDDVADTLAHILMKDPDWTALPATVPPAVVAVLRRCLQKDRKQRVRDIGDVSLALEGAFETAVAQTVTPVSAPSRGSRVAWVVAAAAVLAAMALAIPTVRHLLEPPPDLRVVNTTLLPPEGTEFAFVNPFAVPAISPDGTRVVFGARTRDGKTQLWVRRLDSPTAQPLPGTEDAFTPFWSPDSRWVGFGQTGKLKKIDIQGGPPVSITDLVAPLRGGSWNPEGVIVFGVNAPGPIQRVAAAGGAPAPAALLEKGKEGLSQRNPWFLPDGRHFLFTVSVDGEIPVGVGSLDEPGTPGKIVAQVNSTVAYAEGHLLYLRENTLMAQPFDVEQLQTTGEAVPVAEGIPTFSTPSRIPGFTVSSSGLLVYQAGASTGQSRLVWKDRQGKALANLGEPTGLIGDVALSPDGTRAATNVLDRTGKEDLWIYDVARGIPTRLTFDPANDRSPVWSPDGNTIYFSSPRKGPNDVFRRASNGTGTDEVVLADSTSKSPTSVSPDGTLLMYQAVKQGPDLWVLPLSDATGGGKIEPHPHPFLQTPFNEAYGRFSPDGQWVVYASNDSGQFQIYAAPFPGPGGKRQISSGGGNVPRWRRDGKEIFYGTPDGQLMAAEIFARNGTFEIGRVQKLFDGIVTSRGTTYDVSADGQKFLVVDDGAVAARPLTLLQNWTMTLRK